MIIVLPVCKKDVEAALRNLAWCVQLNPLRQPFICCISRERTFTDRVGSVQEAARRCFTDVRDIVYEPYRGKPSWPSPQNYAFRAAALYAATHFKNQPWFWWEQDAVLLKPDAFQTLIMAHTAGNKPFLGTLGASPQGGASHINGVAVYPSDACRRVPGLLPAGVLPFDVAGGSRVLQQATVSSLIQHVWAWNGSRGVEPPTFTTEADLGKLHPEAVIFHRCKDASLVELLSVRLTSGSLDVTIPKPSLIQTLMRWKYGTGRWLVGLTSKTRKKVSGGARIVHCVERHKQANVETERRVGEAFNSWVELYRQGGFVSAHTWDHDRNSEQIGDSRRLPFLKDVLVAGLNTGRRDDHVCITNDDTLLHRQTADYLLETLKTRPAVSSFRINFDKGGVPPLDTAPAELLKLSGRLLPRGDNDLGRDLFAFRKDWLRDHWHEIPDFLLGELEWDLILAYLIRRDAGVQTTKFNMDKVMVECEMPKGYVIHERHNRLWTSQQHEASPAKQWNRKLATEFYCDNDLHSLVTNKL